MQLSRDDGFLTVGEAAQLFRKSPDTVRNYERRDKLAAFKSAKGVRFFRLLDVQRLLGDPVTTLPRGSGHGATVRL
jgi:hypothetical protein